MGYRQFCAFHLARAALTAQLARGLYDQKYPTHARMVSQRAQLVLLRHTVLPDSHLRYASLLKNGFTL